MRSERYAVLLPLLVATLALVATNAFSQCSVSLNATFDPDTLLVNASATVTAGGDYDRKKVSIFLMPAQYSNPDEYLNDYWLIGVGSNLCVSTTESQCTVTGSKSFACLTGPHKVVAKGGCSTSGESGGMTVWDEEPVPAPAPPTVALEYVPATQSARITYNFPGTNNSNQRSISLRQNGRNLTSWSPGSQTGDPIEYVVTGCGELEVEAVACGQFPVQQRKKLPFTCNLKRDSACQLTSSRPVNIASLNVSLPLPLFTIEEPTKALTRCRCGREGQRLLFNNSN